MLRANRGERKRDGWRLREKEIEKVRKGNEEMGGRKSNIQRKMAMTYKVNVTFFRT